MNDEEYRQIQTRGDVSINVDRDEFNQVKTQVAVVLVEQANIKLEQNNLRNNNDKIATVVTEIAKQLNLDEQMTIAIRERTDQHSKHIENVQANIEHLQAKEVDNSKLLNQHDNDIKTLKQQWDRLVQISWGILKWVAVTGAGLGVGVFASHFIH